MKRIVPLIVGGLFTAAVLAGSAPAAPTFSTVPTPNPNVHGNVLNATDAITASDVWAVGFQNSNNLNESQTLIEHWDGAAWNAVPSPNPGLIPGCPSFNTGNVINDVAAVSSTDVWAVGFDYSCRTLLRPMILHWNGRRWSAVATPAVNTNDNAALNGVVALAKNDVWAVGYQPASNGAVLTLVEHWNGTSWSVVPSPGPSATGNVLSAIAAVSPTDIWAVGDSVDQATTSVQTLVEHYDGTSWKVVTSPNPLPKSFLNQNVLASVHAVSSTNVWAVGHALDFNRQRTLTLIEHWNGTTWTIVPSPNDSTATGAENKLRGVTGFSQSDLYAVGFFRDTNSSGQHRDMVQHFNGTSWSITPSPSPGTAAHVNGVDALSGTTDLWAVGAWSVNETDPETDDLQVPNTLVLFSGNA